MKRWQFWLGVLISLFLLYIACEATPERPGAALAQANWWWLVPGVTVYFIGVWARAWRWHYLLKPLRSVPTSRLFPTVAIGYFGNNILPARAGEILRAVV